MNSGTTVRMGLTRRFLSFELFQLSELPNRFFVFVRVLVVGQIPAIRRAPTNRASHLLLVISQLVGFGPSLFWLMLQRHSLQFIFSRIVVSSAKTTIVVSFAKTTIPHVAHFWLRLLLIQRQDTDSSSEKRHLVHLSFLAKFRVSFAKNECLSRFMGFSTFCVSSGLAFSSTSLCPWPGRRVVFSSVVCVPFVLLL